MSYSLDQLIAYGALWKCPHCGTAMPAVDVRHECPACGGIVDRKPKPFSSCDLPGSAKAAARGAMAGTHDTIAAMSGAARAALSAELCVPEWQVEDAALNMAVIAYWAKPA